MMTPVRPPTDDDDLRYWLGNMIWHHRFADEEITAATGLDALQIAAACERLGIVPQARPPRSAAAPLLVLPYPGGRHPRIGFREGALHPQRETKISVFTPWDPKSYVVVDVPEAIWSNLGLLYLAHEHDAAPTLWVKRGIRLPPREWIRHADESLTAERTLPNGVAFGVQVRPARQMVKMEFWLRNGTGEALRELWVQNCVLLRGAAGFTAQAGAKTHLWKPVAACGDESQERWVMTAWLPCHRVWQNPPCPCIHSDPQIPDCLPGRTRRIRGILAFYEGDTVDAAMRRLAEDPWLTEASAE